MRSLISIVGHYHQIEILGNVFTKNSGSKGIIYIDTYPRTNKHVLIATNIFTKNAGYMEASVIYVRARTSPAQSTFTSIPSEGNLFCTGYHFEGNVFNYNFGCSESVGGVINFECVTYSGSYCSTND